MYNKLRINQHEKELNIKRKSKYIAQIQIKSQT